MPKKLQKLPSKKKQKTTNKLELELLNTGFHRVIGIDEVGRGAWAGPVVVAAYVYYPQSINIANIRDSKLVPQKQREQFYESLQSHEHKIVSGNLASINNHGVGKAITDSIYQIVSNYDDGKTAFLIDGYFAEDFGKYSLQVKGGDLKHYAIAAASNLGKVYRDRLMYEYAKAYPMYKFESNVGYGTSEHRQALAKHGPCEIHRTSFKPIKLLLEQFSLL